MEDLAIEPLCWAQYLNTLCVVYSARLWDFSCVVCQVFRKVVAMEILLEVFAYFIISPCSDIGLIGLSLEYLLNTTLWKTIATTH